MHGKTEKENLLDRAADLLDLPGEIVAGMARVTVTGARRVFVENHRGILEYGEEEVVIHGGKTILHVRGKGLRIHTMTQSELLICGSISGIDWKE